MWKIREVAEHGRLSVSTVERAVRRGELRAYKLGSGTRISAADAEQWFTARPVQVQVRAPKAGAA